MTIDGRVYALYNGIVVEVMERQKGGQVMIQSAHHIYQWVNEKDLEEWQLPGIDKMVEKSAGQRKEESEVSESI